MHVPPFSLDKQLSEIGHDIESAVSKVLLSGQYIGGQEVQAFETAFADFVSVPHVVGCNSGTDALVLALRSLDIGPGDEVITVSFSFFATAEAIRIVGARPVFVDIDPSNYLININSIKKAISSSTKAILPVHLFGCPVDMDQVMNIARENELKVVEDCAQASGAYWNGKPVGSWGDIGCFSFFPTKNLGGAGDGGAVSTKDPYLAKRIRELSTHGMPKRYFHTDIGYNSRLDALQAAILNVKLPYLTRWVNKRKEIAKRYQNLLSQISCIELPETSIDQPLVHAWNQFVVKVKTPSSENKSLIKGLYSKAENINDDIHSFNSRDSLKDSLSKKGVNTIIYYPIPIHLQPAFSNLDSKSDDLVYTEQISCEVLSLPIFPELSIEQQQYVVDNIIQILK